MIVYSSHDTVENILKVCMFGAVLEGSDFCVLPAGFERPTGG